MAAATRKVVMQGLVTGIVAAAITFVVVYVLARSVVDAGNHTSLTVSVGAFLTAGALGFLYGGASALAVRDD